VGVIPLGYPANEETGLCRPRLVATQLEYAKFFRKLLKGFTYVPRVQPSSSFR